MSLTIPGLPDDMVHGRADWERDHQRVATWVHNGKVYVAPRADLSRVDGNADHWPGSTSARIDTSTDAKMIARLRGSQNYYVTSRGYSLGYNFAIDERGHVWEIRGFGFRCAANFAHNSHILAVTHILGADQKPSEAMINSSRLVHKECARRAGRATSPWHSLGTGWWISGHRDLRLYPPLAGKGTVTTCCGPNMYDLILTEPVGRGGELHPNKLAPEPEEDIMQTLTPDRIIDTRRPGWTPTAPDQIIKLGVPGGKGFKTAQLTFTIVNPTQHGHLQTWPSGDRPVAPDPRATSFHNYVPGQPPSPQTLFVVLDDDGTFELYVQGSTDLIVDFTGLVSN